MQISYNWLKNYAAFSQGPEELAVLLTNCGLEVEALEKRESVPGGLKGVVTGKVLSCVPHPNAGKLKLTRVDVGGHEPLPIVCGAPNVKEGQKVLVALAGTTLYTNKGEFPVKKAKIRGEVSDGMVCAEDELGLGDSHEGIMVLPDNTPVGMNASEYFQLAEDWVFEIGLTPNRIDAASHIGVARDLVAVHNHQKGRKELSVLWPDVSGFVPDNHDVHIPVYVEDPDACHRYSSLTVTGITVKESPGWLKNKLTAIGLKPINNVVDVTNFVLHELGQPLHAFDLSAVPGNKVIVKKSPRGTIFETLDEESLELTGDDLMICNASQPMCMGGILGGIRSGVTEATTAIFLESACFDPISIRKSSRHHGLKTDASFRFERGSDPEITVFALKRAALLIKEVAGGTISSDVDDVVAKKIHPVKTELGYKRVHTLIGKDIPAREIQSILEDLDFQVISKTDEGLLLSVPSYRVDVTRDADVVEEILRIYGYNNVDVPQKMHSSIVISPKPDKEQLQNVVSDMLSARGFNEIMNNSLTKAAYYEEAGFDPMLSVHIRNPLSQDLNVLRQTLLFGGLESIGHNKNRKVRDMKLYEFGNVYTKTPAEKRAEPLKSYHERMVLALFLAGRRQPETWYEEEVEHGFFDLKNSVYAVLCRLGLKERMISAGKLDLPDRFDYCMGLFVRGKHIGNMGLVSKQALKQADIRGEVFYGMLEWDTIVQIVSEQSLTYRDVPKFPEVRRDLALLVDTAVHFASIEEIAHNTEKEILQEVNLFDVYQDDKLGKKKKSYAVSFIFQDAKKTLTDEEVDKVMEKLTRAYEQKLGAAIR